MATLPVVMAGCASRPSGPTPADVPAPVAAPVVPEAPPSAPAHFSWTPAPRRFEVRTDVDVTRDPAAPGEAPERVQTTAYVTDTLVEGATVGAVRAAGAVDSVVVVASDRVRGGPATGAAPRLAPIPYQAASDARGVRVEPGAGVDLRCTAPAGAAALGALAAVRETLPRVPANTQPGARWRDTTITATCAGPALLLVQRVGAYEASAGPGGALLVVRRATATLRGQGAAGVRPVAVAGTSTTTSRWTLDPVRGALVAGDGEGETALTVTVAGQPQRFVQRTRTRVVVRP